MFVFTVQWSGRIWIAEDLERNGQVFVAQRKAKSEMSRFPEYTKDKNREEEGTCEERKSYVNSVPRENKSFTSGNEQKLHRYKESILI